MAAAATTSSRATPGDDRVDGGAGDDVLHGNSGDDVVTDDAGRDTLYGWEGDDRIDARDASARDRRRADVVICGPGRDVALVDRNDRVAPNCERVRRG